MNVRFYTPQIYSNIATKQSNNIGFKANQEEDYIETSDIKGLFKRDASIEITKNQPIVEKHLGVLNTAKKGSPEWIEARNGLIGAMLPSIIKAAKINGRPDRSNDLDRINIVTEKVIEAFNKDAEFTRSIGEIIKYGTNAGSARLRYELKKADKGRKLLTGNKQKAFLELKRAEGELNREFEGKKPVTADDLAKKLKIPKYKIYSHQQSETDYRKGNGEKFSLEELLTTREIESLNDLIKSDESGSAEKGDFVSKEGEVSAHDAMVLKQLTESVQGHLKDFSPLEQGILRKSLFEDKHDKEIAQELEVTTERAKNLRRKGLKLLRARIMKDI